MLREGGTALHSAAENGDQLVAKALLQAKADVNQLDQ
jgi:ankyrin repeat protein